MPYKLVGHRIATDMTHPWVVGYRRHPFMRDFWRYVDVTPRGTPGTPGTAPDGKGQD
jgi:hypothetical protein